MRGRLIQRAGQLGGDLLAALLPSRCVCCASALPQDVAPVCAPCRSRTHRLNPPHCPRCQVTRRLDLPGMLGCAACAEWPDSLVAAASPFYMNGVASRVVHALKYEGATALTDWMAREMEPGARRLLARGHAALVPVPIAKSRLRERGYNQAALLAESLATIAGWGTSHLLQRSQASKAQATLSRSERSENVAGSVSVLPSAARFAKQAGSHAPPTGATRLLLVDDVLTTGSTAGACAAALEAAGFSCVGVVTFARAVPE